MLILRDFSRTEHDDFVLNVAHHLNEHTEAVPVYDKYGELVGWRIQQRYE